MATKRETSREIWHVAVTMFTLVCTSAHMSLAPGGASDTINRCCRGSLACSVLAFPLCLPELVGKLERQYLVVGLRIKHRLLRLLRPLARLIRPRLPRLPDAMAPSCHAKQSRTRRWPLSPKRAAPFVWHGPIFPSHGSWIPGLNMRHVKNRCDVRDKPTHNGVPIIRVKPPAIVITSLALVPTRTFIRC